jgi:hypothetical protein
MRTDPLFPAAAFLPLCPRTRARSSVRGTSCGGWADDDLTDYTTDDQPAHDEPGVA